MAKTTDKAAVEQTAATPVSVPEEKAPETVDVQLDGQGGQLVGDHEVYSDGHLLAVFKDGVAVVEKEVAKLLKELGLTK